MVDEYFQKLNEIIKEKKLSSRVTYAIKNVIELRENKWIPRRTVDTPRTLKEIHKEMLVR